MTERVKIKCDDCKFVEDCVDYGWQGCKKFTPVPSKPMTNEGWRKTCSAEEFAEWISNLAYACMRCGMSNGEAYCHTGYCIQDKEDAEKWLKEKHNGNT